MGYIHHINAYYAFGTMTTVSRVVEDRHRFRKDILESDVLKRIFSVNK